MQMQVTIDNITLINGDCIEYMDQLDICSIDLIIADPPYHGVVSDQWDNQHTTLTEYLYWSKRWIKLATRSLKPTGSFYLFGGVGEISDSIIRLKLLCDELGLYFKDWITWKKDRGMGNRKGWLYTREEILWYVINNSSFTWNEEHQYTNEKRTRDRYGFKSGQNGKPPKSEFKRITNVWTDISDMDSRIGTASGHSTPKPERLIERIILAHTKENDTVLDPFLGTGTTASVCKRLNRKCIGIELETESFLFALNRVANEQNT